MQHHWRARSRPFTLCGIPAEKIDRDKPHSREKSAHLIDCHNCLGKRKSQMTKVAKAREAAPNIDADWGGRCDICGQSPTVPETGMCGPCTFGESETMGGNW